MIKNLVIVESPAKAKTIEKFLGQDYKVLSSFGHIRDLKKKEFSINVQKDFSPIYEIPSEKKKLVSELKQTADEAEVVWLASDEDREGEAIAWHLAESLKLEQAKTRRIVFHEITKSAILNAIENPREIDINLVNAQQARRVLDRIVGFELSPVLWKKVKPALSAGRVQSVTVKLIVEREREINAFVPEVSYRVVGQFLVTDAQGKVVAVKGELNTRFSTKEEAQAFLEKCNGAQFKVEDVVKRPVSKSPAPPFTTSTLQQEASRKIGLSVSQTMRIAQKLYESGLITYMRTDSFNLSNLAIAAAKSEIIETMGEQYSKVRKYQTKSQGAQEAHEAIRPSYLDRKEVQGTAQEKRLYDMIWKRTIASQMSDAQLEKTTATIAVSTASEKFLITGEVVVFDGFLRVYTESTDEEKDADKEEGLLPAMPIGSLLSYKEISATERYTQQPARYSEAMLVRKLEELGIGRPSTYAPTISTIQQREYVEKGEKSGQSREYTQLVLSSKGIKESVKSETFGNEKGKLVPTDIGMVVNDFLQANFPEIMDYHFTAKVEGEFDEIADGKVEWHGAMSDFYKVFHPTVEKATAEKSTLKVGERILGTDPKSGKPVSVKIGRFGPMLQLGVVQEGGEKPQFASLFKGESMDTITLEEALRHFELPRELGIYQGKAVVIAVGKFGPYIRYDSGFTSIPAGISPLEITLPEAIELLEKKSQEDANRQIKTFAEEPELEVLNGRYGPYIAYKGKNYKIPRTKKPAELTLEECKEIIESSSKSEGKKPKGRTARKS